MTRVVFMVAWKMSMMLLRVSFSMPTNVAVAALMRPLARMVIEASCISGVVSGRLNAVVAMVFAVVSSMMDSSVPMVVSKMMPAVRMLRISLVRFSARYCAVKRVMAVLMPQSLNMLMSDGAVRIMV